MTFRSLAVCVFLCVRALPALAGPSQIRQSAENGAPVVINPDVPRDGDVVMTGREAWRMGADETNDPLLARITDIATDAQGISYLLDGDLSVIHVVDPDGELLRTIGSEGDGPGQFRNATELVLLPEGDVGVLEMMTGTLVVMDTHGEPRASYRTSAGEGTPMVLPGHIEADRDGVVLGSVSTNMGADNVVTSYTLARYRPDGRRAVTFIEKKQQQSGGSVSLSLGGDDDDFTRNWTLTGDGGVVVFRRPFAYELQVYAPDGSLRRTIRRDYETLRRPTGEIADARRQAEEMQARYPNVRQEVEERARDISAVFARPAGELWVATSAGDQARSDGIGLLDVIDAEGRYVRTLRIDGVEYDPQRDTYLIEGDRLFVLREAQMLPPRTTTSGGGGMQMIMIQSSAPGADDEVDRGPLQVVCYELQP
jgi:hypothetical protein